MSGTTVLSDEFVTDFELTCSPQCLLDAYNAGGIPGCDASCLLLNFSMYGFRPGSAAPIAFIVVFSLSTLIHAWQMIRARWWLGTVLVIGGLLEILGWAGRLWGSKNPFVDGSFIMQVVCLIIAPAFFSACLYACLGIIVQRFGRQYCRLSPVAINVVFVGCDVVSLVVQATGGALAATATDSDPGTNIMIGGILFQTVAMVLFTVLALDVLVHMRWRRPVGWKLRRSIPEDDGKSPDLVPHLDARWKAFVAALAIGTALIFWRCIFRAVELFSGWHGRLLINEVYLNTLDGMPMALFLVVFNVLHPTIALGRGTRSPPQPDVEKEGSDASSASIR